MVLVGIPVVKRKRWLWRRPGETGMENIGAEEALLLDVSPGGGKK